MDEKEKAFENLVRRLRSLKDSGFKGNIEASFKDGGLSKCIKITSFYDPYQDKFFDAEEVTNREKPRAAVGRLRRTP
jgi:hypothetical protein